MKNAQITMKGLDMIVILNALQKEAGEMMDCFADSKNMEEELAIHGGALMDWPSKKREGDAKTIMEVENAKNMGKFITQNANQDMIMLDAAFVGQTLQIVEPLD